MSLPRPDTNAKQMFLVGLLGLPWLWVVNVMYHWKSVYGSPTNDENNDADADADAQQQGNGNSGVTENTGILAMMASEDDNEDG